MDNNAAIAAGRWAREGSHRVRLVALCVSLVIHVIAVIVLVVYDAPLAYRPLPVTTLWTLPPPEETQPVDVPDITQPEITQPGDVALEALPVRAADESDAVVPRAVDLPYSMDILPINPGVVTTLPDADPTRGRLEYRAVPERDEIWRPAERVELSADELARERVAARLNAFNDSLAIEAGARAKATDWTTRTPGGQRWGVTADSIYVGNKALPNFVQFSPPPGRREEIAGRLRTYSEIQYQVNRAEGNDIINDRIRAIRARMDAARAKRNATTTGG
jgi:hypothetical protein